MVTTLITAAVLLAADTAMARADEATGSTWYGWQTGAADAGAGVLVATGFGFDPGGQGHAVVLTGVAAFVIGGPVVHAAHGNWGRAGLSLGVRTGGPVVGLLVGGLIGSQLEDPDGPDRSGDSSMTDDGMFYGLLAGIGAAAIVDSGVVAWEADERPLPPTGARLIPPRSLEGSRPMLVSCGGRF